MKVLVTGASGFVGSWLVPALKAAGHHVVEPPGRIEGGPDLARPQTYAPFLQGVEALIHLAAFNPRAFSLASLKSRKMLKLNSDAAGNLASMAAANGCKLFIFASSARVYGIGKPPYAETAPLVAPDNYGRSKIEAERRIMSALNGTSTIPLLLRLPVFVEKPGGLISLMRKIIAMGIPLPSQAMKANKSVVRTSTFCNAVLAGLEKHPPVGGVFNVADGDIATLGRICSASYTNTVKFFRMPEVLNQFLGRLPLVGYAWRHAVSDCVLDVTMFETVVAVRPD